MVESTEIDEPDDDAPQALPLACGEDTSLVKPNRRPDSGDQQAARKAELTQWAGLDDAQLRTALREVIGGGRAAPAEALVYLCRRAHEDGVRQKLNLAFEALSKVVTPLLLSQAWGMSTEERRDQVQQILLEVFAAIQGGKAGFAERSFAAFAKRRAISLYRKRRSQFEGVNQRIEPSEDDDPIDSLPARLPSAEARALLAVAIDKLPPKHRTAFIQYHHFEMTQEEIATHHGVDESTVRYWLKKAAVAVGLTGDENDR